MNTRPLVKAGSVLAAVSALLVIAVPNAGASLSFTPASHNFGDRVLNSSTTQQFTLKGHCDNVLVVSCISPAGGIHTTNLAVTGSGFSMGTTTCGTFLNASADADATCTVNVIFHPTSLGAKTGALTAGLAASGNDITAALSGNSVSAPVPGPSGGGQTGSGGTQGAVGGKRKKCKKPKRHSAAAAKQCKRK